jgi:hypothetical protein
MPLDRSRAHADGGVLGMKISLSFARTWDAAAWKTVDLHPQGAPAFLLRWDVDPWPGDDGVPGPLIAPFARAMAALGPVVFRLFRRPKPPLPRMRPLAAQARPLARVVFDGLTGRTPPPLAIARDEAGAAEFLDQGWSTEAQLGFLFTPRTEPDGAMLAELYQRRTWHGFAFPNRVQALIAPPTDGDGVFVAGRSEVAIRRLAALIEDNVVEAGFSVATAFRADVPLAPLSARAATRP